jgi:uncharacterized protein (DUF169 family)
MRCAELTYLETITGAPWTGMRFSDHCCSEHKQSGTLCEAIARSFKSNFTLLTSNLDCPGALRCLGFKENEEKMMANITKETGANMECIRNIIACSPRMDKAVYSVELGNSTDPALCAGYLSPEAGMKLLRQWQMMYGRGLSTDLSSFMALCSAVVAACKNNALVFSMGCPESRRRGGVAPGQLFAVLPRATVQNMMEEKSTCRHMNTSAPSAGVALNNSRK